MKLEKKNKINIDYIYIIFILLNQQHNIIFLDAKEIIDKLLCELWQPFLVLISIYQSHSLKQHKIIHLNDHYATLGHSSIWIKNKSG